MSVRETGWLPDFVFVGDKFEAGLAFFADELGRITRFSRDAADLAAARPLKGQAAVPGLVNSHAESWGRVLRGRTEPRTKGEREPTTRRQHSTERAIAALGVEELYDVARMAFLEMLLAGTTTVGEWHVHGRHPADAARVILRAARDTGIRIAFCHAATGPTDEFIRDTEKLREFVARDLPGDDAWLAIGAQTIAGVANDALKTLSAYAHAQRFRLHLPLSETQTAPGRSPVALLADLGLLDKRFVGLRATRLDDDDIRLLGAARAAVCACPTAELMRGHGGAPADQLLEAGVTVALGTGDGERFDLLLEARMLEQALRVRRGAAVALPSDIGVTLLHAATSAGARALGGSSGALEVGRPADFFTVNLFDPSLAGVTPESLVHHVVFALERRAVREVWVGARQRVAGGRHLHQGPIVGRFVELQHRVWGGTP